MKDLPSSQVVSSDRSIKDARIQTLELLLYEAAATFRKYEALHAAKGTPESLAKAGVNAALANKIELALTPK